MLDLRHVVFLVGPTACGKSDAALVWAERLDAEIVSLDSMLLYRGMDVGTAKPSIDDRRRVPHHLIDVLDVWESCSLGEYVQRAEHVAEDIARRGRVPLFVGGTGLYLKGLLRGVFEGPPADWDLRRRLHAEADANGTPTLHARLADIDPEAARRIHPNDLRRITRALEVYEKTGRPISELQTQFDQARPGPPARVYCLTMDRQALYGRINARVRRMFEAGLVDECRRLLALPHPVSHAPRQALGYKEVFDHLAGRCTRDKAVELIQRRSRRLARHQLMWYRRLDECTWVDVAETDTPAHVADRLDRLRRQQPGSTGSHLHYQHSLHAWPWRNRWRAGNDCGPIGDDGHPKS